MSAPAGMLAVGDQLPILRRTMTRERMRWYCDALETALVASGEFTTASPTIHTDDEYARSQGLSGIVADGMISTNYLNSLLTDCFGADYLERSELRTRFIRPVYEDEVVEAHAEVTGSEADETDVTYELRLWCTADGVTCTVGEARVHVPGNRAARETDQ